MIRICNRAMTVLFVLLLGGSVWLSTTQPATPEAVAPSGHDRAQSVAVDSDGNVVVTGYSYRARSDYDFLTIKYDADGRLLWTARYDGPSGSSDYASVVSVDSEGNIYSAGHSNGRGTSLDLTVVKYDKNGQELWIHRYDGPSHRDDYAQAMAVDDQANVYVTGYSFGKATEHDFVTMKLDSRGVRIWEDRHNPPRNRDDSACDLVLVPGSGIVITGTDRIRGTSYDFLTIRYGADGTRLWESRYSTPGDEYDTARALDVGTDGSVYVTGYSYHREAGFDMVTLKYDSSGGQVWRTEYSGTANRMDAAIDIAVDASGRVYVAGKSLGEDSAFDMCLLKYNSKGRPDWQKRYNGPGNGADVPAALRIDSNSQIIMTGYSRSLETGRDMLTIKYDSDGSIIWEQRWSGQANGEDCPVSMAISAGGDVIVTGYSRGEDGTFDFLTLKYGPDGKLQWVSRWPDSKQS